MCHERPPLQRGLDVHSESVNAVFVLFDSKNTCRTLSSVTAVSSRPTTVSRLERCSESTGGTTAPATSVPAGAASHAANVLRPQSRPCAPPARPSPPGPEPFPVTCRACLGRHQRPGESHHCPECPGSPLMSDAHNFRGHRVDMPSFHRAEGQGTHVGDQHCGWHQQDPWPGWGP